MTTSLQELRADLFETRSNIAQVVSGYVERIQERHGVRVESVRIDMTGVLMIGQRPCGAVTNVEIEVKI